jgi:hypothetical protein
MSKKVTMNMKVYHLLKVKHLITFDRMKKLRPKLNKQALKKNLKMVERSKMKVNQE